MGAYLSSPVTEKISTDEANGKLNCGTSSMQGWRESQEDAHNCIIDYDTNTSYFAVYDGHGGHEVALYCSQKLPDFLKQLDLYKEGNYDKALEEAFLQFDATIPTKEVIAELKEMKGSDGEAEDDSEDEEDVNNLYEEATMPIEQVIKKYTSNPAISYLNAKSILSDSAAPSKHDDCSSKTSSTSSATAENSGEVVSSSSCVKNDVISSSNYSEEKAVSSGLTSKDSNEVNNDPKIENKVDSPDSSGDTREVCTPSKNSTEKEVASQNGEVESTQNCDSKSDVSSSSTPHENGEVVKKGKGKALTKTKGVVPKRQSYKRPKISAKQYYNTILSLDEGSEEESEDEKDETFEGPNDDSSDDDDEILTGIEGNSDESSVDEEEDEEEEAEEEEIEDEGNLAKYDNYFYNMKMGRGYDSGCTAVVALLKDNNLYVANAGDSRCIVCRNGQAIEMSVDHKPEDKAEYSRIYKAGGCVDGDGRVNGGLNLSRAIGDHSYKQNKDLSDREQMITALPDVKTLTITPGEDEFMVIACDGIWNSMSSQEVVDFVKPKLEKGELKLSEICGELFDRCLSPDMSGDGTGCDNMTAIIVQFKADPLKRSASDELVSDQCKKMKTEEIEAST